MRGRPILRMRRVTVWPWPIGPGRCFKIWSLCSFIPRHSICRRVRRFFCRKPCEGKAANFAIIKASCSWSGTIRIGALAPRDIVSRAIWAEMAATRARHVYLDVTHLGCDFVKRRFPTIYATCLRYDIDMTEEWIPVSPSAHYMMGGVWTDVNGATTLPGLVCRRERSPAVECMEPIGLASNSLLEGLVFGMRAALAAMAVAASS